MKKTLIALLLAGAALPAAAQEISETESVAIKGYFLSGLAGDNPQYSSSTKVALADVAAVEASVWDLWKQANDAFDEEKLPKLYSLNDGMVKKWQLPADLEPSAVMPYLLGYKPPKQSTPRPLLIFLHGSGDKETEWAAMKTIARQNDDLAAYFIPQIPNGGYIGGISYYRWYQKAKQWAWEKLIRQVNLRDDYDINKICFMGISEGAYGTQRLGSFYADYLAGIGPMAGGEPLNNAPVENLRNIGVHFRTGSADIAYERASLTMAFKDSIEILQNKYPDGYVHDVMLYQGLGHTIPYGAASPWLVNQTRNPYPKHVNWEDYEMDTKWRKGFYNIQIVERAYSQNPERGYYQMDIEDNNIDLKVSTVYYVPKSVTSANLMVDFDRIYSDKNIGGRIRIYLNDKLVDLSREVTLTVNGKQLFKGMVQPTLENMVESCALYFDRARVYPASINVDLTNMTADAELAGVDEIATDNNASVEYYNLQGMKVENPASGIFIRRQGATVTKVVVK